MALVNTMLQQKRCLEVEECSFKMKSVCHQSMRLAMYICSCWAVQLQALVGSGKQVLPMKKMKSVISNWSVGSTKYWHSGMCRRIKNLDTAF